MSRHPYGILMALVLMVAAAGAQSTFFVDSTALPPGVGSQSSPFTSIQSGINAAAASGDLVLVAPGNYVELIDFQGKEVEVRGQAGATATTIDGNQTGPIVTFASGEGVGAILDGFRLTNGLASGGAAVFVESIFLIANARLRNCLVDGNSATSNGGAVEIRNGFLRAEDCVFIGNTALNLGGAIMVCEGGLTLDRCVVDGNQANRGGGIFWSLGSGALTDTAITNNCAFGVTPTGVPTFAGGGVFADETYASLLRCEISDNEATSGHGGGVVSVIGELDLRQCIISSNSAANGIGGGFHVGLVSGPTLLESCLIESNIAAQGAGVGCVSASPTIRHSTISANIGEGVFCGGGSSPILENTIDWGNSGPAITIGLGGFATVESSDIQGGWTGPGSGNIDADPLFVGQPGGSASFDFHLRPDSPCLDAGNAALTMASAVDIDGHPRNLGSAPDQGADEYFGPGECGTGTAVGAGGSSVDILLVNGSSGGISRRLDLARSTAFSFDLIQPPLNPLPAPFVVWGLIGVPSATSLFSTGIGDLCFPPHQAAPNNPLLFTLANSLFADPLASLPATLTPWNATLPFGIPFAVDITLQGLTANGAGSPSSALVITNAVTLRII